MKTKNPNGKLARFHILAQRAWERHAYEDELDISDRHAADAWRRSVLQQVTGKRSSKELSTTQFEAAMLEFAMVAQDDKEMAYWSTSVDRRYRNRIRYFMDLLTVARNEVTSWSYVRSIMDRMHLPEHLDDIPKENLQDVMIALDSHFRKLCRDRDLRPVDVKKALALKNEQVTEHVKGWFANK